MREETKRPLAGCRRLGATETQLPKNSANEASSQCRVVVCGRFEVLKGQGRHSWDVLSVYGRLLGLNRDRVRELHELTKYMLGEE